VAEAQDIAVSCSGSWLGLAVEGTVTFPISHQATSSHSEMELEHGWWNGETGGTTARLYGQRKGKGAAVCDAL